MDQHEFWRGIVQAGARTFSRGEYRHAHAYFSAAAIDAKKRNHKVHLALSLHNVALVYAKQGRKMKAIACLEVAVDSVRRASPAGSRLETQILDRLAQLILTEEDPRHASTNEERQSAIELLETAHQVDCNIGGAYQQHMAKRLKHLAHLYCQVGDYEQAYWRYREACDTELLRHDREMLLAQKEAVRANESVAELSTTPAQLNFSPARETFSITTL